MTTPDDTPTTPDDGTLPPDDTSTPTARSVEGETPDPDADPDMLNPRTGAAASGDEGTGYDDPDADPANLNPREG